MLRRSIIIIICICFIQVTNGQSSIEQKCYDLFVSHIIYSEDFSKVKVYFKCETTNTKTPISAELKEYFPDISQNYVDSLKHAPNISTNTIMINCKYSNKIFKSDNKKRYKMELYPKTLVGEYYYVLIKITHKSKGYLVYFQLKDIESLPTFVVINYII